MRDAALPSVVELTLIEGASAVTALRVRAGDGLVEVVAEPALPVDVQAAAAVAERPR